MAAYRFLIDRMFTLPIGDKRRQEEWMSIKQMAHNNVPMTLLLRLKQKIQQKLTHPTTPTKKNNTKWALFTYSSPQVRKITNIFKKTNLNISFKPDNTNQKFINPTTKAVTPPHDRSRVYSLTCDNCKQKYMTNQPEPEAMLSRAH
jgi:hypothetical protein